MQRLALAVVVCAALVACGRGANDVIPDTALGSAARGWLFAHNQGDGHAMVHFTLNNRGTGPMAGAQVDSAVYDGVKFARTLGPLTPVSLLQSSDTLLVIIVRTKRGDAWHARFAPARQPSAVKVDVRITPA